MNPWNLDVIAQSFAHAALDPRLWGKAIHTIAVETNSFGTILFPVQGAIPSVPEPNWSGKELRIIFATDGICGTPEVPPWTP